MTDRPMHEVVSECEAHHTVYSVDDDRGAIETEFLAIPRTELAAVLKAADAVRGAATMTACDAYDAAVADLRRVLEGK